MKFTSSPSSSSSTFPASKGSVFGCLSFVLRRFLRSRTLPFDQLREIAPFEDQSPNSLKYLKSEYSPTPNLVARLMGLNSMPDADTRRGSTRSRSMNSIDCRLGETEEVQGKHRRMNTSVSFRETPSYFELEDDDFFVLRFGEVEKSRTKEAGGERNQRRRRRRRRTERMRIPKEQGRRHGFRIEEGDDLEAFVHQLGNLDDDDVKVVETESESENLSPVSVLDHSCLFMGDHEAPTSAEEETTYGSLSPGRKLVSELSNLEHPSNDHNDEACPLSNNDRESSEVAEGRQAGLRRKDYHRHKNVEMLTQICRLADAEMVDSEWDFKGGIRNFKKWEVGIGVELGLQIVDQLLDEVVHQLL